MRASSGRRYPQVWDPRTRRMIRVHRLVAEHALGRALVSREVVHHLDGNRDNNHPANLAVLSSQSVHAHLEALLRKERGGQVVLFAEYGPAAIMQGEASPRTGALDAPQAPGTEAGLLQVQ